MMMTAAPAPSLQSPKLAAAMNSLSVKRPSLSPLKRKLADEDDESTSPTATAELPEETSVISPLKKAKLAAADKSADSTPTSATWTGALALDDDEPMDATDGSDEACAKVLAAYTPIAWEDEPATPLDAEELDILQFFLS